MSFIYNDKNLLDELFKAGQATDPAQNSQVIEMAKKLVKNLQTEAAGGTVFTSERADAHLDQIDLSIEKSESVLSNLLYFLQYNGIKANSKTLVFKAPFDLDSLGETGKLYVQYPEKDAPKYYVYKDGLIAYVNDLKKRAAGNPIFLANIAKLQQSIATELPAAHVPSKTPHGPQDPRQQRQTRRMGPGGSRTQDLHKLLNKFPLLEDRVDFQRIENFIMSYTQITGESSALVNTIDQSLTFIHNNFGNAGSVATPLDTTPDRIASLLPPNAHPAAFIKHVKVLITNVNQLLTHLKSIAYDQMDEQLQQQLDRQTGTGPEDGGSIAYQNLSKLEGLEEDAMKWRRTK